jgi:hypothetical protein
MCFIIVLTITLSSAMADERSDALRAAKQATRFLTDSVSTEGGYLWRYSSDLSLREGEGVIKTETVWTQPPGTPSVGEAFVRLYRATGDQQFLDAAMVAAESLRRGQMRSGGWQAQVEFEPSLRKKWAYRVDPARPKAKDQSSLDDDKTQSALRFLIQLDQASEFKHDAIHEMTTYALHGLIQQGQFPNGGFPQVYPVSSDKPVSTTAATARYPSTWPREYPGHREYWYQYTLNDNLATDLMKVFFLAHDVYQDDQYQAAALRLADSLLIAQMPAPQPAWAQQYNQDMEPIWARKFEPPAISGGESQSVIETLMAVYQRTGEKKYLDAVEPALDYLQKSELPDGRLARFYELKTNRPLYFTQEYELTYSDADCPTHYGFQVGSRVDSLRSRYERLRKDTWKASKRPSAARSAAPTSTEVAKIVGDLDHRGAWVTNNGLRYHRYQGAVIEMQVAVDNLNSLAAFLAE